MNRGEWRASVGGIAAAVLNAKGEVEAAIGVSGPIERIAPNSNTAYHDAVIAAAERVSRELGCADYQRQLGRVRSAAEGGTNITEPNRAGG